jgi:hypothetical protein
VLYSHNLIALAEAADLSGKLAEQVARETQIGNAWLIVKDWKNELRYASLPFPDIRGQDMLLAVHTMGLISWLIDP